MRKILLILALIILGAIIASFVAWANRANIAANFLSRNLHVPVTIRSLEISRTETDITRLWIGNPPRSKTSTAFSAETIAIISTYKEIMGDPLIIEEIDISNVYVGLEYYRGKETNWDYILGDGSKGKKGGKGRDYLIRTLILENLTVEVTQPDGKIKRYPTIARMEFHNISSDSGFPIEEIEKAIFNLMMQDLFKKLPLDQIFKQIPGGSPLQYLPGLFN
jgi:hypothetical protein